MDATGLLFNTRPHRVDRHQAWLFTEKVADGSKGIDFGYRADIMYGVDAAEAQSFGNNPGTWDYLHGWDRGAQFGWAMPQLYAQVAAGELDVIMGHFFTIAGYETVAAPKNFFYSHSLTMFNSEPFTHTGVLAKYKASPNVTYYGGWTLGWDTGFDEFDPPGGANTNSKHPVNFDC